MIYGFKSNPKPIVVFQIPADLDQGDSLTERTDIFLFLADICQFKRIIRTVYNDILLVQVIS